VLIAISTYTELVPVVVNEPQQLQEPEDSNRKSFEEFLAEALPEEESAPENETASVSEIKIDVAELSSEETDLITELNFLGFLNETVQEDFTEKKIPDELLSSILNSEFLNSRVVESLNANSDDFSAEISGLITEKNLPELELGEDFFAVNSAKNTSASQIAGSNSAMDVKETSDNKKDSSKERNSIKLENVEAFNGKDTEKDKIAGLRNKPENENFIKQDDLRSRSKRNLTFEVKDMRTETVNNTQSFKVVEASSGRTQEGSSVREITLELRLPESRSLSTAQSTWETKAGTALENMLARELHQNLNGDIVRHASIALRNGGEGTIKLALKPESLGNVKIHLEMTENKITGRIVVESTEALNAFRKEMSALEQAFRDSGFANADLDLSLTADNQSTDEWEQEDSFTPRMAALRYEGEQDVLSTVDVYIEQKHGLVNMLA
jgi:flagellar hook-length control protein FliK